MSPNPDQSWVVIGTALIVFAGVCVSALATRRAVRDKAAEKSVEERFHLQAVQISVCEKDRAHLATNAEHMERRIEELEKLALKLSGDLVEQLVTALKQRKG